MSSIQKEKKSFLSSISLDANMRDYTMVIALIIIAIIFQIITKGTFLNPRNVSMLIRQMSIVAVLTTGMLMLIVSGNFDLSVGSIVLLAGGIPAVLQVWFGWSTVPAIIVGLIIGCILGSWQGYWVAYKAVPSFIVTLGGMMIFKGIYLVITNGITIGPLNDSFSVISQGFVNKTVGMTIGICASILITLYMLKDRQDRIKCGFPVANIITTIFKTILSCGIILLIILVMNNYNGVPYPVLLLAVVILVVAFITKKTTFGRIVFAIGGNKEAAKYSGIKVERIVFVLFVISGFLSAISGILSTSRLDGATASAGMMFEMDAIAACVIGGTSLSGGRGTIFGAMIGALIMASLDNGMSLMNTSSNYQYIVKGLVLILAVWMDVKSKKQH